MKTHPREKGTGTFIRQRVTGVINIAFVGFLIWLVVSFAGATRAEMAATFSNPFVAILALALIASPLIHMRIGMYEVIEDYVHDPKLHALAKTLNTIFVLIIGVIAAVSVLVLAFGG
ncbi:succinate dehydrogenase, hydrophobic membrane anchor protein [Pelagibacterium sp. 26DY04]|uniref:succinate dehydrogenase, hydrophobic membrane anchor protein n=1 Tax=unclassified Pelagibacterium TaxID=2623280 RepID=UPI00281589A4|nr:MULTISPECIES: succinate dehydrogenase, hydrophobic membrane anchor protein [unclassified Pelagibacterium]WMT86874.1 succinate dehydrogenase, hydrophobic membrane anchor protein [Pelagibacterium sp. 26DY04]WMT88972.1 succinate dehydrogenase, hydrophobic membrane anchor protein [Pelagibacterium sp. H642]